MIYARLQKLQEFIIKKGFEEEFTDRFSIHFLGKSYLRHRQDYYASIEYSFLSTYHIPLGYYHLTDEADHVLCHHIKREDNVTALARDVDSGLFNTIFPGLTIILNRTDTTQIYSNTKAIGQCLCDMFHNDDPNRGTLPLSGIIIGQNNHVHHLQDELRNSFSNRTLK